MKIQSRCDAKGTSVRVTVSLAVTNSHDSLRPHFSRLLKFVRLARARSTLASSKQPPDHERRNRCSKDTQIQAQSSPFTETGMYELVEEREMNRRRRENGVAANTGTLHITRYKAQNGMQYRNFPLSLGKIRFDHLLWCPLV